MTVKNILVVLLSFCLLSSCEPENKTIETKTAVPDYYNLMQGAWETADHEIYYIDGFNYKIFQKQFYTGDFSLNHDTIDNWSLMDFPYKSLITSISTDSLKLKNIASGKVYLLSRPSEVSLKKDTVSVKPDSIISVKNIRIYNNTFEFSIRSDYEEHCFLQIKMKNCSDSCIRLTHDVWFDGGNCNSDVKMEAVYELVKDKLIFYIDDTYVEHMNDNDPHSFTDYIKETYVIRKSGQIIRIKTERDKKDPAIAEEVKTKIIQLGWRED